MKQFTSTRLFAVTSVVAAMLAAGCSEENNEPVGNASNAAIVTASIGKADNVTSTRASNTVWDADDCIGISTSSAKGKTNYINIQYKTDGSVFKPVSGAAGEDNTIYFQDTSPTEFTAYYPYEGVNGTKPGSNGVITRTLTVADQSTANLPAIDSLGAANSPKQQPEGRFPVFTPHEPHHPELQGGCRNSTPNGRADLHPHRTGNGRNFQHPHR